MDNKEKAMNILLNTIKEEEVSDDGLCPPRSDIKSDEIDTKTTLTTIKKDAETDYSKTIRHGIIDFSSYAMVDPTKRKTFSEALKADATINEYVDEQLYTKWLKTNNPHFKCAIVYSYLYLKELNKL